jgi:hypothetical protein
MPPLASSFIPDTAALIRLGEWVKTYRSNSILGIRKPREMAVDPKIRNRVLTLPADWKGKVFMADITGRKKELRPVGPHIYALPAQIRPGIYFFQAGPKVFRAAIMPP